MRRLRELGRPWSWRELDVRPNVRTDDIGSNVQHDRGWRPRYIFGHHHGHRGRRWLGRQRVERDHDHGQLGRRRGLGRKCRMGWQWRIGRKRRRIRRIGR
jgi:hypothetical protein